MLNENYTLCSSLYVYNLKIWPSRRYFPEVWISIFISLKYLKGKKTYLYKLFQVRQILYCYVLSTTNDEKDNDWNTPKLFDHWKSYFYSNTLCNTYTTRCYIIMQYFKNTCLSLFNATNLITPPGADQNLYHYAHSYSDKKSYLTRATNTPRIGRNSTPNIWRINRGRAWERSILIQII
jgi:hypothetical protein